jgi:Icc-related predicted phosphoesterase
MSRRLTIEWPDPTPFRGRDGAPIRLLAVSDLLEPTLVDSRNRSALAPLDLIVGCGDLDCDDLAFLADSLNAPLVYVQGNHDTDARWKQCTDFCPEAIHSTSIFHRAGVSMAGLTWPGQRGKSGNRSERAAWSQALRLATRRLGQLDPMIVLSHVPPLGAGDVATDPYHRGFKGYRWLLERLEPTLWLHGHTPLAATSEWKVQVGNTTVVNVTGAVIIELLPPKPGTPPVPRLGVRPRARSRKRDAAREPTTDS